MGRPMFGPNGRPMFGYGGKPLLCGPGGNCCGITCAEFPAWRESVGWNGTQPDVQLTLSVTNDCLNGAYSVPASFSAGFAANWVLTFGMCGFASIGVRFSCSGSLIAIGVNSSPGGSWGQVTYPVPIDPDSLRGEPINVPLFNPTWGIDGTATVIFP